jgi:hypothetical protein
MEKAEEIKIEKLGLVANKIVLKRVAHAILEVNLWNLYYQNIARVNPMKYQQSCQRRYLI